MNTADKDLLAEALKVAPADWKITAVLREEDGEPVLYAMAYDQYEMACIRKRENAIPVHTIARKERFVTGYQVITAEYDKGDPSVGIEAGYMLDIDAEPDSVCANLTAACIAVVEFLVREHLQHALANYCEYQYWLAHNPVEEV